MFWKAGIQRFPTSLKTSKTVEKLYFYEHDSKKPPSNYETQFRMNPRGRWRRSRNLRRVPTTEEAGVGEGSKISPLRRSLQFEDPSFGGVFSWYCLYNRIGPTQKGLTKKKKQTHTHTQISADLEVGWVLFPDTLNAVIARRSPQKRVPNQVPRFP